jgi:hypothetical protein
MAAFKAGGNPHIVETQPPSLSGTRGSRGYGLDQIVAATAYRRTWSQGSHVKARKPHVTTTAIFCIVIVLEFARQHLFVGLVADNGPPVFRVVVARGS